jgi:hypothetical protein
VSQPTRSYFSGCGVFVSFVNCSRFTPHSKVSSASTLLHNFNCFFLRFSP